MYKAYITYVKNIRPAENSDFLNACEVFGNTTIIDKTITEDTLVLYFPSDGQISIEFGEKNNLFRKKDDAGNNIGGFVDPVKRNITAIRLRGNRSDGLVLPISCLNYCYTHDNASAELHAGDIINGTLNGHEICCKYIPVIKNKTSNKAKKCNKVRKHIAPIAPLFIEHADTEQLNYNLDAFKPGDQIEITLKMHGTSNRVAYVPVLKRFKRTLFDRILGREGKPIYEYDYISGTRRTVLDNFDGGFYGSNAFRKQFEDRLRGKLLKNETCYFEIVGFTDAGVPIMPIGDNNKVGKDFVKQYGEKTVFSYGCEAPQSEMYVYRMTITNEDGDVVEYSPDFMRYRCEQIGVKTVPVFYKGYIPEEYTEINTRLDNHIVKIANYTTPGEWVKDLAEEYYDGPDPIGKTHVREGVVVRIVNRPKFCAYKTKNFSFKLIEGIVKESAQAPDMEEAQDLLIENEEEIKSDE